jgi:hypothetical protein
MVAHTGQNWCAQGYVQAISSVEHPGVLAYYRARWDEIELIGAAEWMSASELRE